MGRIEEELKGIKGGWIYSKWMTCMCEILKQLKKILSLKESSSRMECFVSEEISTKGHHAGYPGFYPQQHRKLGVVAQASSSSKG